MDRWISIEERLPEPGEEVLLLAHGWEGRLHYTGKPCSECQPGSCEHRRQEVN